LLLNKFFSLSENTKIDVVLPQTSSWFKGAASLQEGNKVRAEKDWGKRGREEKAPWLLGGIDAPVHKPNIHFKYVKITTVAKPAIKNIFTFATA